MLHTCKQRQTVAKEKLIRNQASNGLIHQTDSETWDSFLDDVDSISFFLSAFVQRLPDYDEWAIR